MHLTPTHARKLLFTLLLVLWAPMLKGSVANAAEAESVGHLDSQVAGVPTWKATESSVLYDLSGTQIANGNSYAFGHVRVWGENLGLERALTSDWKIYLRTQYLDNDYELIAKGKVYDEKTSGLGDTALGTNHTLVSAGSFKVIGDAGLMLPTGSIDYANQFVPGARYKYFLQLGSGTVDETLGLTALEIQPRYQIGFRLSSILREYENRDDYRLGNLYRADTWADLPVGYGFTPRLVAYYRERAAIEGADPTIPRASSEYYFHDQIDWSAFAALKYEHALVGLVSVLAEVGAPLAQGMQNYDNVVISTNYYGTLAISGQF